MADPLHRLSALVTALDDRVRAAIEAASGLTGTGPDALLTIGHVPGLRVDDLATMLRITHSGTVRTVDRLVAAGLVGRLTSRADRRTVELSLTARGWHLRRVVVEARNRVIGEALAPLEPSERNALGLLVDRVLAGLAAEPGADHSVCRLCDPDDCATGCPVEAGAAWAAGSGRAGTGGGWATVGGHRRGG